MIKRVNNWIINEPAIYQFSMHQHNIQQAYYEQWALSRTKEIIIINEGNNWIIIEGTACRSHSIAAARRNIKGITNEL